MRANHAFLASVALALLLSPCLALAYEPEKPITGETGNNTPANSTTAPAIIIIIGATTAAGIAYLYKSYDIRMPSGPTAAMVASKNFTFKEDVIGGGLFNFLDAQKLKDLYGYTLPDALGVAYSKNPLVRKINGFNLMVEETQSKRLDAAENYPQPIRSIVKFAASYTMEVTAAVSSLVANGFFGAGSLAVMARDSAASAKSAKENAYAIFETVMGSLFRWVEYLTTMTLNEDPEVTLGAFASYAIAPEDAVISGAGKAGRAAKALKKTSKESGVLSKAAKEGRGIANDAAPLSELMEKSGIEAAVETGSEVGKTFIEVSEINTQGSK